MPQGGVLIEPRALPKEGLGYIGGHKGSSADFTTEVDGWELDHDDLLLIAMLQDGVYCPELLWDDVNNRQYAGCYRVRDHQYPLFRADEHTYAIYPSSRDVGKTESIKGRAQRHVFKRSGEDLLITAPELIHLLPLTDAIESRLRDVRLTREFLDTRNQKTGFTHRPFQVDFIDGTKIIGRIPKVEGTGVKGMHVPDLIIDEGQDYPKKGWIEVEPTVLKDHRDDQGRFDFTYHVFGVHSGAHGTGFHRRATGAAYHVYSVTRLMTEAWNKEEKRAAIDAYGGTAAPDYRRNVLGEAGSAALAYFVLARLMACLDQDRDSDYNTLEYQAQVLASQEIAKMGVKGHELLDLPSTRYASVWGGMDIGLVRHPTVISLFADARDEKRRPRLKLFRRFNLVEFTEPEIRATVYAVARHFGARLKGFGMDMTGVGLPMRQTMEGDEEAPEHFLNVSRGYMFNASVPVAVEKDNVREIGESGHMKDQFGNLVKKERDPLTGLERLVTYQTMIEASTRYLREFVDDRFLWLPFDKDVVEDMQAETQERVKQIAGVKSKPNALHILDSFRGAAMAYKAADIEAQLETDTREPVMETVVQPGLQGGGGGVQL